jgi:hypothetical protein
MRTPRKRDEEHAVAEQHFIAGPARGEPLPAGSVGARVRIPLSGTPSASWSRVVQGRLAKSLIGHPHIGYLRLRDVVQGAELVLEGVEGSEAAALGPALREAVGAANRKGAQGMPPPPSNMPQDDANAIAAAMELDDERPGAGQEDAAPEQRSLVPSLH